MNRRERGPFDFGPVAREEVQRFDENCVCDNEAGRAEGLPYFHGPPMPLVARINDRNEIVSVNESASHCFFGAP